jgi:hypothetical protein
VTGTLRRWPLFVIAAPAATAVWSGWVGLGNLCGFGMVHPLPGILPGFQLNTAITLPIGVEAYGAYALGAWLTPGVPDTARRFARGSAIGALALGMLGQVAYHLLAARHATRAPVPVVVLVSCLPVVTLGFGAALAHLLRSSTLSGTAETVPWAVPGTPGAAGESTREAVPGSAPAGEYTAAPRLPVAAAGPVPAATRAPAHAAGSGTREALPRSRSRALGVHAPEVVFAAEIEAGTVPSVRQVKSRMRVGQDKAVLIRGQLAALVPVSEASEMLGQEAS